MKATHSEFVNSISKARRFVLKVGTSSLTDENSRLDVGKIANLVSMLMKEKKKGRDPVLISSGAIGAGVGRLGLPGRPKDVQELQAAAAVGQGLLMQTYEFFFNSYEQPVAQLLLTREDFTDATRYRNLSNTLETLIKWGVIPIVNENDTVATEEIKVGDNDTLASYVTLGVKAELLVILSDVDGLYTANPSDSDGVFVKIVERVTPEVEGWASSDGKGFGGMYTKVQAAKKLSKNNVATIIANHSVPDALHRVFTGEIGTVFLPAGGEACE